MKTFRNPGFNSIDFDGIKNVATLSVATVADYCTLHQSPGETQLFWI